MFKTFVTYLYFPDTTRMIFESLSLFSIPYLFENYLTIKTGVLVILKWTL